MAQYRGCANATSACKRVNNYYWQCQTSSLNAGHPVSSHGLTPPPPIGSAHCALANLFKITMSADLCAPYQAGLLCRSHGSHSLQTLCCREYRIDSKTICDAYIICFRGAYHLFPDHAAAVTPTGPLSVTGTGTVPSPPIQV